MRKIILVTLTMAVLLSGLLLPARAADAPSPEGIDTQMYFEMPPKDDPFYEDLPGNHVRQKTVWPKVDFQRLRQDFEADEWGDGSIGRYFQMMLYQIIENDFQFVLLNYPRLAFVYRADTGDFKGITDEGVFHLGFSYNLKQSLFYATKNPWMRVMGYNAFYDWLADDFLGLFQYLTRRVRFAYDGLDYLVQIWKGQYFFKTCLGAEIGFYTKPQSRSAQHYDCLPLSRMMPMSLKLYSQREIYGPEVSFDLPPEDHWWAVMMAHRVDRVNPHRLTLESSIDFAGDPGLGDAFFAALQEQCPDFVLGKDGDVVWFCWEATERPEPSQTP